MMDREVTEPEAMGILVATLIAGLILFALLFLLYISFKIYRFKRSYDKDHARSGTIYKRETIAVGFVESDP